MREVVLLNLIRTQMFDTDKAKGLSGILDTIKGGVGHINPSFKL